MLIRSLLITIGGSFATMQQTNTFRARLRHIPRGDSLFIEGYQTAILEILDRVLITSSEISTLRNYLGSDIGSFFKHGKPPCRDILIRVRFACNSCRIINLAVIAALGENDVDGVSRKKLCRPHYREVQNGE